MARFTVTVSCRGTGCSRVEFSVETCDFFGLPAPYVSWTLGKPRWPPPIAAVRPLGALPRPGCAHTEADPVHRAVGQMCTVLGRRYGFTPSVHRLNPLHG